MLWYFCKFFLKSSWHKGWLFSLKKHTQKWSCVPLELLASWMSIGWSFFSYAKEVINAIKGNEYWKILPIILEIRRSVELSRLLLMLNFVSSIDLLIRQRIFRLGLLLIEIVILFGLASFRLGLRWKWTSCSVFLCFLFLFKKKKQLQLHVKGNALHLCELVPVKRTTNKWGWLFIQD